MPWSTPAATASGAHHFARPSACATSVSARHSRVWPQRGTSCVAGTFGCAFRSPLQTRIGTGTGIRPPCLPERTSVTGRRSRTRAGSAGKRPATHTGSLLPVSKRRGHPGGEVNAGGFGGQSPTTRARSAHDIKPRRFLQYSAGRYSNWQPDLLFVLKQEQDGYEFCQQQMAECDRQLAQYLQQREDRRQGAPLPEEKRKGRLKKKSGNKPQFDLRTGLFRMSGTDLTRIDGIDVMTATTVISEAGYDMSKWQTENHFVSWLRLCPDNRISGNKVIGKGRLPTHNPISIALKIAATTLRQSQTYLGAQFRRLRTKLGAPVAIKAMAAKLARLVYRMLRYGMKYVDQGAAVYELKHRELQVQQLKSKAAKLGYKVTLLPAA